MGDLIIELALALLAATLIGWLMGRFLCKSGEYDERVARRRLETELANLTKDLEVSRETADGLRRQLGEQAQGAASAEQVSATLRLRLASMEAQVEQLLGEARELEVCNARRQALEAELEEQQALVLELRSACDAQAQQIRALNDTLNETRAELHASDAKGRRSREEIARGVEEITASRQRQAADEARIATLQQEKSGLERQLQQLGAKHDSCMERLQALTAAVDLLHQRIRERGASGRRSRTGSSGPDRADCARDKALAARPS
jgi:septal ring factor EnvC (AmiA/AmiB activator)